MGAEVRFLALEVKRGGLAAVKSDEMVLRVKDNEPRVSLIHGFPHENGKLPWQTVLEMLIEDPRFGPYRVWLERVRDSHGVHVTSKKRPREEDDCAGGKQKPSRV